MKSIIIDVFNDPENANKTKEKMMAMGKKVEIKEVYGITVNEYVGPKPSLKYEKDGNPLYVLIAE